MPTGYTYMITEKKATFNQFVWACARAFGALMHMRDDASGTKIRKEKKSTYHEEALMEANAEVQDLKVMTLKAAQVKVEKQYEEAMREHKQSLLKHAEERARYESMLEQVQAWVPPSKDHQGLKDFMIQQVTESIKFDCGRAPTPPKKQTAKEWLATHLEMAEDSVKYHAKHLKEDEERTEGRNQWVDDLEKSVPMPKELL